MVGMETQQEHFGIPSENMKAASRAVRKYRNSSLSCKVPTRNEVLKLDAMSLEKLLFDWMRHSTIEIIPSRLQIAEVIDLLGQRQDKEALARLISMCQQYIRNS